MKKRVEIFSHYNENLLSSFSGMLVVNVTWRNKTYVGTLLDCTRHDWAPPRYVQGIFIIFIWKCVCIAKPYKKLHLHSIIQAS